MRTICEVNRYRATKSTLYLIINVGQEESKQQEEDSMRSVVVTIGWLMWIGFVAGCSTIPNTNQGTASGLAQIEPEFILDSKTVQSAKLQSFGNGGYGIHFTLSDAGWSEIRRISARRPLELAIRIAGRTAASH